MIPPLPAYVPHYRALLAGLGLDRIETANPTTVVDTGFLAFLIAEFARLLPFDPAFYTRAHPDVPAAIAAGLASGPRDHFARIGYQQGRPPHALVFDAAFYAGQRSGGQEADPAAMVAEFLAHGRHHGRPGHPDALADALRWRRAAGRAACDLARRSIPGALVRAFEHPLVGPPGRGFRGGLVLTDAPQDLPLRHRRGDRPVDSFPDTADPVGALGGEYVYGGPYCAPFGHAMAEMIHRVLPGRTLFDCRRLLFVGAADPSPGQSPAGFAALPPTMQAALHFLQVAPDDVTVIHDHRAVQMLHVAQMGSDLSGGPTPCYLRMLADFTPARLHALDTGGPEAPRIYVSRSRIAHGGLLLGERYLEQLLQAEGWRILHPQDHSLVAQMAAYHRARIVLFAEGSACHGVELFGAEGLQHCVLLPRRTASRHVFDSALRPRARRYDVLPEALLLGSAVADPHTGAPVEPLGVSALALPAVARALRDLGLARLTGLDLRRYRRAARADLAAYLAHHRSQGTALVGAAELAALHARAAAALG